MKLIQHERFEFVVKLIKKGKSTYIIHETLKSMGITDLGYTVIDNFKKVMFDEALRRYLLENMDKIAEKNREKIIELIPKMKQEIKKTEVKKTKEDEKKTKKIAKKTKNKVKKQEKKEKEVKEVLKKERKNIDRPSIGKKRKNTTTQVSTVTITDKELDILQMRDEAIENMKTGIKVLDKIIAKAKTITIDFEELEKLIKSEKNYVTLNMMALADLKIKFFKVANESVSIQNRMINDETNRLIALANERREQETAMNNEESIFKRIQRDEERFIEADYSRK